MQTYLVAFLVLGALCQNFDTQKEEYHIPLSHQECTKSGCQTKQSSITLDANWRWLHNVGGYSNCFTGVEWDRNYCPDPATCTRNCAVDGVPQSDWNAPYGVNPIGKGISMRYVTHGQYGDNIGSRVYLLENEHKYKMFKLLNREFSFEVDISQLECGLNGALYFVEMESDGGSSKHPTNKAGAKYGTGYCDAQCPHDIKYIWGEANCKDWKNDQGHYGTCCAELDIWESNKYASAYTAHPCKHPGYYRCEGVECGDGSQRAQGNCDKDGCDLNAFRNGNQNFFGPGSSHTVDTTKPVTVVTQFITSDQTDNGDLEEIKRFYVQNGKKIPHPATHVDGLGTYNSLTNQHCANQKRVFGQSPTFQQKGGMKGMGEAMKRGMVLVMSIWDDHAARMLWLDSDFPLEADPKKPGVKRGPCSRDSGKPEELEKQHPNATVKFWNIKVGEIGTTVALDKETTLQTE